MKDHQCLRGITWNTILNIRTNSTRGKYQDGLASTLLQPIHALTLLEITMNAMN